MAVLPTRLLLIALSPIRTRVPVSRPVPASRPAPLPAITAHLPAPFLAEVAAEGGVGDAAAGGEGVL